MSSDEKEVWIYKITIDGNKDYTNLLIPKKLGDRKVTRPKKVTSVESDLFYGCDNLILAKGSPHLYRWGRMSQVTKALYRNLYFIVMKVKIRYTKRKEMYSGFFA